MEIIKLIKQDITVYIQTLIPRFYGPLTDIGSNGQNLQQPNYFVYMNIITRVPYYSMELLYYSVYLQYMGIL